MKDIKQIIAKNLIELRKANGLTQSQLGDMINYSDKAVSKWERAEASIDIETLYKLSEIFNISMEYFFEENNDTSSNILSYSRKKSIIFRKFAILALFFLAILLIAVTVYVAMFINDYAFKYDAWILFPWTVPLSSIVAMIFCKKNHYRLMNLIMISTFLWTLIASIFLTALVNNMNIWMIFLVGVPIEAAIVFMYFLSYKSKEK